MSLQFWLHLALEESHAMKRGYQLTGSGEQQASAAIAHLISYSCIRDTDSAVPAVNAIVSSLLFAHHI